MAGTLVVYQRPDRKWAWRLRGENFDDIIATDGGQGYENESYCESIAKKVVSGHYKDATLVKMPLDKSA